MNDKAKILAAIDECRLTDQQRLVISLFCQENFGFDSIGNILNIRAEDVKRIYIVALETLEKFLQQKHPEVVEKYKAS